MIPDSILEAQVQQKLEHLMKDRTTFVIAHRLTTIRYADRIIMLEKGRMIQLGDHDTLMKKYGLYRHYSQIQ